MRNEKNLHGKSAHGRSANSSTLGFSYINGNIVSDRDSMVHVSDLLFQRGYGIFDLFRIRNGRIPWLEDYISRLFRSLELADLGITLKKEEIIQIIDELQQLNNNPSGAIKIIVTGGYSETFESVTGEPNIFILFLHWKKPPEETFKKGVNLISWNHQRPTPEIKTLNYFNTLRLRKKMQEYKAVDVLFHSDMVTEASRANVFFVEGNRVYTPENGILKGITRKQVVSLFPEIEEKDISFKQIHEFDEVFISSTTRDVTPVIALDGKKIGNGTPGKITREIQAAFYKQGW